jgi:hypothetical protein
MYYTELIRHQKYKPGFSMGTPFSWPTGFPPRSIKGVLPGVR